MSEPIVIHIGDLLYLDSFQSNVEGWYVVTDMSRLGITLNSLKHRRHAFTLPKARWYQIVRHIRAAAVPGAIEALERLEMTAGQPAMDDDPVRVRARAALRAVRGEE